MSDESPTPRFDPYTGEEPDPQPPPAPEPPPRFDPLTGEPVQPEPRPRFDPYTGKPLEPQTRFDPYTGERLRRRTTRFFPRKPGAGYIATLVLLALFWAAAIFATDDKGPAAVGAVIVWVVCALVVTALNYAYRRYGRLP
ncbi:MAG TPA: hypothetical protein VFI18_02205 [Gaiellales bacterium]|nr:hypothetical protein [Gaiellales bacterium]